MSTPDSPAGYSIEPLAAADKAAWWPLWEAYLAHYKVDLDRAISEAVWQRMHDPRVDVHGLAVKDDRQGKMVGFSHYVLHPHTWSDRTVCYLEDLYVDPGARRRGIGRQLIEHLKALCRQHGWKRLYWHSDRGNVVARGLYDDVGTLTDYVRYAVEFEQR